MRTSMWNRGRKKEMLLSPLLDNQGYGTIAHSYSETLMLWQSFARCVLGYGYGRLPPLPRQMGSRRMKKATMANVTIP
jgi:hypothetical protein